MIGRVAIAIVVLVIATITYPGALLTSLATRLTPPRAATPGPTGPLPWLHVEHPSGQRPYIADEQNRIVILRGATPASLVQYGGNSLLPPIDPAQYDQDRCPSGPNWNPYPPLCRSDIVRMAALGFNSMRLPIAWSLLEPERARFDDTYVDRIAQIVGWARDLGMYVIIDMHQNAFSFFISKGDGVNLRYNSGAPKWATLTDGFPSFAVKGQREVNPAVFETTTNFWYDRDGIQDEYIAAVAHIARRFKDDSTVEGFGIFNEPWFGWNLPPGFDDLLLFPFYRRVIDAVTGARDGLPCWTGFYLPASCGYRDLGVEDRRHLIFLDTGLLREITDFPTHLGLPLSSYPNVVLALHAYTHVYTIDYFANLPRSNYPWAGYDQSWDAAEREAKAMDMALFLEEFGSPPGDDSDLLKSQLAEAEKHRTGFAFWTWAENDGSWGLFDSKTGCVRKAREQILATVYPRASSDIHLGFHSDYISGAFALIATGRRGDPPTVVYIPPEVAGDVTVGGAATGSTITNPDGSRLVTATPNGGQFTVSVAAHPQLLAGCA